MLTKVYNLDTNLCLLRLYQFYPERVNTRVLTQLLLKVRHLAAPPPSHHGVHAVGWSCTHTHRPRIRQQRATRTRYAARVRAGSHVVLGCGQNTKHQALTLPAAASVASPSTAPYPHSHGGRRCRQVRVCASWLADLPSPAASTCTTRTALHARRQGQATTDPAGRGEGDGLAPARTTQRCQEHGREIS